jgi:flagellar hook protein FlgE
MIPLSVSSLHGLQRAQAALDVAGHNIANLATAGFRRQQISGDPTGAAGVDGWLRQAGAAGPALERDLVDQLVAKNSFLANLAVFKTGDHLMGTLLDATG